MPLSRTRKGAQRQGGLVGVLASRPRFKLKTIEQNNSTTFTHARVSGSLATQLCALAYMAWHMLSGSPHSCVHWRVWYGMVWHGMACSFCSYSNAQGTLEELYEDIDADTTTAASAVDTESGLEMYADIDAQPTTAAYLLHSQFTVAAADEGGQSFSRRLFDLGIPVYVYGTELPVRRSKQPYVCVSTNINAATGRVSTK
jgi:hypothetical protein